MSSLAAATSQGSGIGSLLIFALPVLLIVYMFMQQRRRQRQAQSVQASLQIGEEVSTTSGLIGRVAAIEDAVVALEVSPGVVIRFDRRAIAGPTAGAVASSSGTSAADDAAAGHADAAGELDGGVTGAGETPSQPTPPAE